MAVLVELLTSSSIEKEKKLVASVLVALCVMVDNVDNAEILESSGKPLRKIEKMVSNVDISFLLRVNANELVRKMCHFKRERENSKKKKNNNSNKKTKGRRKMEEDDDDASADEGGGDKMMKCYAYPPLFTKLELLGRGSFGKVYVVKFDKETVFQLGQDPSTTTFALKEIELWNPHA